MMKEQRVKEQNLLERRKKEKTDKANKYLREGSAKRRRRSKSRNEVSVKY